MAFTYTKRKDGRLMKRVSVNGKIETLYSSNPKDLEKQYIEKKSQSNKGIFINDEGLTVENWANKWLDTYKSDKQLSTKEMYEGAVRVHIVPKIGNIKLKNLKQSDIQSLLNCLDEKPRQKEIVFLTVKQILDKAVDNDYIYKNVAKNIKVKKHKAKEKRPLSPLEIEYLKKCAKYDSRCFMLLFMLYTGIRRAEAVPLLAKDINIENKTISINKSVHWSGNKTIIKTTKNEDIRTIPILDIIFDDVCSLKKSLNDSDLLFPMNNKKIMTRTAITRNLQHCLREINKLYEADQKKEQNNASEIKKIVFTYHQLRHTYACLLHKANIDLKEAQYLTGHRDLKVLLDIYTHLDAEDHKNATEKLNLLVKI